MPDLKKQTDSNSGNPLKTKYVFSPRLSIPSGGNPYYNNPSRGGVGYNSAIIGNIPKGESSYNRTGYNGLNVLPNCVGYAYGRFNEIVGEGKMSYLSPVNAGDFMKHTKGCKTGIIPKLGAVMVWKDSNGPGHVAVVEKINSDGSVVTSESEWNGSAFTTYKRYLGNDGNWIEGCSWMVNRKPRYHFQGFIYNPAVPDDAMAGSPWEDGTFVYPDNTGVNLALNSPYGAASFPVEQIEYENVTKQEGIKRARTVQYDGVLNQTKRASLLTYPTNVETPFIVLKVGNFTFGTYNAQSDGNRLRVDYPNFIKSMDVTKINGKLNQYNIQLVHQIQHGSDPNLVDKVFGSVGYGTVKISYGDYNAPTLIYKEEEALITKLTSNVDFSNSRITYNVSCTSTALGLIATSFHFEHKVVKPSDEIKRILFDSSYGLTDVFTGMRDETRVLSNNWIASNDKAVEIEAKENIDPLSYINYLVSCMVCESNSGDDVLLDSSYYLTLVDDTYNEQGGPYFTIKQIYSNTKTINNQDVYEVDIGFPSDAMVMSFTLRDNNSWSLLYNYSGDIQSQEYIYNIDNSGNVVTNYSPAYSTSTHHFLTTAPQKNWWTQMTKFPITATLVIKGLVRPAMLMSFIKVNALFYGQRHISSGIYFVAKQVDRISGSGYRTELTLVRFAGDEDYIRTELEERTYRVAKVVSNGNAVATKTGEQDNENSGFKRSSDGKEVKYSGGGRKVKGYVM